MSNFNGKITLNTIDKVKTFVSIVILYSDLNVEIHQGHYVVDGKSIMGIFSLNLFDDLEVFLSSDSGEVLMSVIKELQQFNFCI